MATHEGDDTQAVIADGDASTTVVPAASRADVAELAWSAEQPETPQEEPPWRDRARWATLAIAVITLAGATGWLATAFYKEQWDASVTAAPSKVVAASAAPPARAPEPSAEKALPPPGPPAQHEEAPSPPAQATLLPPTAAVPPPLPDPPAHAYDTYVQLLAGDGIIATNSPTEMHDKAYWVCSAVSARDVTRLNTIMVESQLGAPSLSRGQIRTMLTDVVAAYCPQYRGLLN